MVGCMIDLNDCTMMFTLNGEVLLDDLGSEVAFKDFEVNEGQSLKKKKEKKKKIYHSIISYKTKDHILQMHYTFEAIH